MKFLIPTYGRACQQKTLKYLLYCGCKDITLQTQTKSDMRLLSEKYGTEIKVLYKKASRLSENANNGLHSFDDGEFVCVVDDDITSFTYCDINRNTRKKANGEQFIKELLGLENELQRIGANVGVTFPLSNQSMASAATSSRFDKNALGTGSLMMIRVGSVWCDESLTSCEDYDVQLREIAEGRSIIRCNTLAPNRLSRLRKNGEQEGGRGFYYEDKEHTDNIKRVVKRYAPIARIGKNGTSIKLDKRFI